MKPDIVVLSHHKCATNWLRGICDELATMGLIVIEVKGGRPSYKRDDTRREAKGVLLNVNATDTAASSLVSDQARNIHFVRDPRDALVSNYFSWRYSHQNNNETILQFREKAAILSIEEGMLLLLESFPMGLQLQRWTEDMWGKTTLYKYESLLEDFSGVLTKMFSSAGLNLSEKDVIQVGEATSFRKLAGRDSGVEDQTQHFRKGVPGDWENYATPNLSEAFNANYGWLLKKLGYSR